MKDDLSQKIHGNMMLSVCSVKMAFLFPTNMKLGITEKDDIHPRKDDIHILD